MNLINSIYTILEEPEKNKASYWFHVFIYTLIIISIISLMLSSVQEYNAKYKIIFTYITNIFQTIWWAVATLTTVGYGDMYPVTAFGKIITAIISILGIAFIAIPGGIFASEFINSFSNEEKENICPKCSSEDLISHPNPIVNFSDKINSLMIL